MSLYRAIEQQETELASRELGPAPVAETWHEATLHFFGRIDETFRKSVVERELKIDCAPGCSYCCHFRVELRSHEAFAIARHIRNLPSAQQEAIIGKLEVNAARISNITADEHLSKNIACAFLDNHHCQIYPTRPTMCRKFHSRDVGLCRQAWENPQNHELPNPEHRHLHSEAIHRLYGFHKALSQSGLDSKRYELNQAVLSALKDSRAETRWLEGKAAFPKLEGGQE